MFVLALSMFHGFDVTDMRCLRLGGIRKPSDSNVLKMSSFS